MQNAPNAAPGSCSVAVVAVHDGDTVGTSPAMRHLPLDTQPAEGGLELASGRLAGVTDV